MKYSKLFKDSTAYEAGDTTITVSFSQEGRVRGEALVIKEIIAVSDFNADEINDSRRALFGDKAPVVPGDLVYVCQSKYRDQVYPYKSTEVVPPDVMVDLATLAGGPELPKSRHRPSQLRVAHTAG